MKNFDWTTFTKRIFITADLATVYNAWTSSEELEKWFLVKAVYSDKNGKEISRTEQVTAQSLYKWNWYAQAYYEEGKVIKTNGIDSIEFTFAGNCIVQVKLSQVKNQTLVALTQTEIPLDDTSKENIRLGCAFGWTFYLLNLKSVLEGGLDLRNKDTEIVGVVNN